MSAGCLKTVFWSEEDSLSFRLVSFDIYLNNTGVIFRAIDSKLKHISQKGLNRKHLSLHSRFINKLAYPEDGLSKEKGYKGQGHAFEGNKNFCDMPWAHQVPAYEETKRGKYFKENDYKLLMQIVVKQIQLKPSVFKNILL